MLTGLAVLLLAATNAAGLPVAHLNTWPGWEPDKGATAPKLARLTRDIEINAWRPPAAAQH